MGQSDNNVNSCHHSIIQSSNQRFIKTLVVWIIWLGSSFQGQLEKGIGSLCNRTDTSRSNLSTDGTGRMDQSVSTI